MKAVQGSRKLMENVCLLQSVFLEGGSPEAAEAKLKVLGTAGNRDFISAFTKLVFTKGNITPL